ncbi:MAG: hypothetical protein QOF66_5889 [Mycobacterium sp.]|nr:hypothetical protein [Mycobacterium sp.]
MKSFVTSVALALAAFGLAPTAHAGMFVGNYNLNIQGRNDFHTWVWAITPCSGGSSADCIYVTFIPQPNARAFYFDGPARLANGRYTLIVDDPYGLRCDNIYYGPTIPTHDVYTWDATTLVGSMDSTFDVNCGGAPGGTYTYPFTLTRL